MSAQTWPRDSGGSSRPRASERRRTEVERIARELLDEMAGDGELREGEAEPPLFPEFFRLSIGDADYDAGRLITTLEGRDGVSIWTVDRAPEPRRLAVANETCVDCRAMDVAYLDGDRLPHFILITF